MRWYRLQWMWNLRLTLGHAMQGHPMREIEWIPSKEAPPHIQASENVSEEYGPWQWARGGGWARGGFGADAFILQENGTLQCPAGKFLWLSEVRQEKVFSQRAVYVALQEDCLCCPLHGQCLARKAKGNRARRVSAVRRLLPTPSSVEYPPGILAATKWVDVAGRMLRRIWIAHWRRKSC